MGNVNTSNCRILANGEFVNNDTVTTGRNNNDLIIGPTGAGKTRGYVIPNILHNHNESFIIVDTKGSLRKEYGKYLEDNGYKVLDIDFVDCMNSATGYNPLDYIGMDEDNNASQQDILKLCAVLCPMSFQNNDPYWEQAAQMMLSSLIALTFERCVEDDWSMTTVCELATHLGSNFLSRLFKDVDDCNPNSFAARQYRLCMLNSAAEKMIASVYGILINSLNPMSFNGAKHLFDMPTRVSFRSIGHQKTALFLTVSDNDRSLDRLINAFYSQALQELIREADMQPDSKLPIPVRLILDDFASNVCIPDFDKTITTIRSRNIAVSLVIQDLTQLESNYGPSRATTISNNCDTWLYLGGQDPHTVESIAFRLDKPNHHVFGLGLDDAILFLRGEQPKMVSKYNLNGDPAYKEIHRCRMAGEINSPEAEDDSEMLMAS